MKHGIYVSRQAAADSTPVVAESGIPYVVGTAPVQTATLPNPVGIPVLCTSWQDVLARIGYSDDWDKYTLCEFAHSHFKLYGCKPVIFCNLLDPATMIKAVEAVDMPVAEHQVRLPIDAVKDDTLIVKAAGGAGDAYILDSDFAAYYSGEYLILELLEKGGCYDAELVNVAYSKVDPTAVTTATVVDGLERAELCMASAGCVPDLICAPKFSRDPAVAAAMALKAGGINGMFRAKAIVDIPTDAAEDVEQACAYKQEYLADDRLIVCWPMVTMDGRKYHMSTHLAGIMAATDAENGGIPFESPSSHMMHSDATVLVSGKEIMLSLPNANVLNGDGIVTALNFGGWTAWGNYTACYPTVKTVEDTFIPISRMFDWVGNTLVKTFWYKLDRPINRRLIDTIVDACTIWLNGLVGAGYLHGARVAVIEEENTLENLLAGIVKVHLYLTPPIPAQEIDFTLEYDASYTTAAMQM